MNAHTRIPTDALLADAAKRHKTPSFAEINQTMRELQMRRTIDEMSADYAARRRRANPASVAIRLAFMQHYTKCPECEAQALADVASSNEPFDTARDLGLLRRDVNEALETITLEALA